MSGQRSGIRPAVAGFSGGERKVMREAAQTQPAGLSRDQLVGWALRLLTAAALITDAVVHLRDAFYYDANAGALLTEGELFRIQAGVAIAVAALVLLWPRWPTWALAFLVSASAAAAVVTYTYVSIGPFAGLPGMHEPSWGPPGKLLSAYAEGAGALLALAGLGWALARRHRRRH